MITFGPAYVRLEIEVDRGSPAIIESIEHLVRVCRLNGFRRALIVSEQDESTCHSLLREALRYGMKSNATLRLALVCPSASKVLPGELQHAAEAAGLECEVFSEEQAALRWLERLNP